MTENAVPAKKRWNPVSALAGLMSAVFIPLLPVIIAAGMLQAIVLLLAEVGLLSETSTTYYILSFAGDAGFYFLPLMIAYTSAKYFGGNPFLSVFLCAILFHPDYMSIVESGGVLKFLSIPVALTEYNNTVIPAILIAWFAAPVERFLHRHIPDIIEFFAVPTLTILISLPVALIVLGPIGVYAGNLLCAAMEFIYENLGWPSVAIMSALCPLIIPAGLSLCFLPMSLELIATTGADPITRTAFLNANCAIAGAAFAVFVRSKILSTRHVSLQASIIALMGITEPSLFGVIIPLKRPYIASFIGAAIGGIFSGITGVKAVAFASPGIINITIFLGDTFIFALLTVAVSFFSAFIAALILGFEDAELKGVADSA